MLESWILSHRSLNPGAGMWSGNWEIHLGSHKVTLTHSRETTRLQQQVGILDCRVRPVAEKTSSFIHLDWMQMPSVLCQL